MKTYRKDLLKLFLIIAFPIHIWSIYQVLSNFEWVAERTTVWDAVGFTAYSLSFALFESILFLVLFTPIYLLLRKNNKADIVLAVIGSVFMIVAIWEMIYQINSKNSNIFVTTIDQIVSKYKLRYRYKAGLIMSVSVFITTSIALPPFLIVKYDKLKSIIIELYERIELLSYFYLALDLLSIVIVIIRNLTK
jgi:hypothetical protein